MAWLVAERRAHFVRYCLRRKCGVSRYSRLSGFVAGDAAKTLKSVGRDIPRSASL